MSKESHRIVYQMKLQKLQKKRLKSLNEIKKKSGESTRDWGTSSFAVKAELSQKATGGSKTFNMEIRLRLREGE